MRLEPLDPVAATSGAPFPPNAEVALLARVLHRLGYADSIAGHITCRQADDSLLVNPWGMTWAEIRARDVVRIDLDGTVIDGMWEVPEAVMLHVALHRARPRTVVAVHNHATWSTIWAAARRIPPVYDQSSAFSGDVVLYDEYPGPVTERAHADDAVARLERADVALLANHGVLVLADSVAEAYTRCKAFEWRSRIAWHIEALGPPTAPLDEDVRVRLLETMRRRAAKGTAAWDAAIRHELQADPSVLDGAVPA